MELIAIILMFFGVLLITGFFTVQKILVDSKVFKKEEILIATHLISFVILVLALLFWQEKNFTLNWSIFWLAVIGTSLANVLIQYFQITSRELGDLSWVAPVSAMTPGLVTFLALFFGERPSLQGLLGIVLITLGIIFHSREDAKSLKEYFEPFFLWLFKKPDTYELMEEKDRVQLTKKRKAIFWAYMAAIFGTIGLIFDGLVARNGSVALGFAIQMLFLTSAFFIMNLTINKKIFKENLISRLKKKWMLILLVGLFYGFHIIFVMTSFRYAQIAYIGSIKRISIVFIMLSSWLVLHEKKAIRRFWPAIIITLGALFIAFDNNAGKIIDYINNWFI